MELFYWNIDKYWSKIGFTKGKEYSWIAPSDSGSHYKIKIHTVDSYDKAQTKTFTDKSGITEIYDLSTDGSLIAYKNREGYVKIVHMESNEMVKNFKYNGSRYIFFSADNKKLISFFRNSFGVQYVYNNEPEKYTSRSQEGFLFASYSSNIGDEYILSSMIDPFIYENGKRKITDYTTDKEYYVNFPKTKINYAAITDDEKTIVFLTSDNTLISYDVESNFINKIAQINPGYKKIIISPKGKYCYLLYPLNSSILKIKNGKQLLNTNRESYLRFSPDGNKLLTIDSSLNIIIRNNESKSPVLVLNKPRYSNFSYSGRYFYYYKNNTVFIYDFETEKYIVEKYIGGVNYLKLSNDEKEFLVLKSGYVEVYDMPTGEITSRITTQLPGGILSALFDINGNILTQSAGVIGVWEPILSYDPGFSNEFKIVTPQPDVLPLYNVGKHYTGNKKEVVISGLIKNNSQFPVKIEKIIIPDYNQVFSIISGNDPFILKPGGFHDLEIGFSPPDIGIHEADISVHTPDSIYFCHVTGEGLNPEMNITDKTIDFGEVWYNNHKDSTVFLFKNISKHIIEISNAVNVGTEKSQFELINEIKNLAVEPGETISAKLRFNALHKGLASGCFLFYLENLNQPFTLNLIGKTKMPDDVVVYGKTLNNSDSLPLSAHVFCVRINNDQGIADYITDNEGDFLFTTSSNNNLLIYADKEGFISGSENIDLTKFINSDSVHIDIYLSSIEKGNSFRLNGVFFDFAKFDLLPASVKDLNRVVHLLQQNEDIKLEIHGHTDNIGSDESNMLLSKKRAESVRDFLVKNRIDANRLSIKYFGESIPVADNDTNEGRQKNRRVEFKIIK